MDWACYYYRRKILRLRTLTEITHESRWRRANKNGFPKKNIKTTATVKHTATTKIIYIMSYEATRLNQVFEQFASFGSGSQLALNAEEIRMDNAKFAKFCRDTNIINKSLTTTDVDIIFKKVYIYYVFFHR
jgi:hypothetical protein